MRRSLLVQAFVAMLAVALLTVVLSGLITRAETSAAFQRYVATLPVPQGMGTGRHMMVGGAEMTMLATVDRGILVGAIIAVVLAATAAAFAAYYLTRPLKRLTAAAQAVAGGDLSHRVDVGGPGEVGRLGDAFNEMAGSLAESETLRRRLVADVAHELRNPIASLRAQTEAIADGVMPADPARLASIADDTRYLSRLVEDLQELAAAEAGQLRYDMQPLDLAAIVRQAVERAAVLAPENVMLVVEGVDDVTATVDEGRIAQVMRNLLDNAMRHTESGSVRVTVSRKGDHSLVEVVDTGEGIPAADLPYIFERFYRADAARARDTGGSGVGLAVSRRIIEDHGGEVHARNIDGGGAAIGFTLPLAD